MCFVSAARTSSSTGSRGLGREVRSSWSSFRSCSYTVSWLATMETLHRTDSPYATASRHFSQVCRSGKSGTARHRAALSHCLHLYCLSALISLADFCGSGVVHLYPLVGTMLTNWPPSKLCSCCWHSAQRRFKPWTYGSRSATSLSHYVIPFSYIPAALCSGLCCGLSMKISHGINIVSVSLGDQLRSGLQLSIRSETFARWNWQDWLLFSSAKLNCTCVFMIVWYNRFISFVLRFILHGALASWLQRSRDLRLEEARHQAENAMRRKVQQLLVDFHRTSDPGWSASSSLFHFKSRLFFVKAWPHCWFTERETWVEDRTIQDKWFSQITFHHHDSPFPFVFSFFVLRFQSHSSWKSVLFCDSLSSSSSSSSSSSFSSSSLSTLFLLLFLLSV